MGGREWPTISAPDRRGRRAAISQTVVGRLALSLDCITDVLDAKKLC